MGCDFGITVVSKDSIQGNYFIGIAIKEIKRIEKLISSWDTSSQASQINKYAGIKPVVVNRELYDLIDRSKRISRLTDGAFDITYASMDKIWKYDGSLKTIPSDESVKKSVSRVGYHKMILDSATSSVFLSEKGMKIGFGAIGKGYAADMAKTLLMRLGVKSGIINASGDMNTWGKKPNGEEWTIAITNPLNKSKAYAVMPISDKAVVTSGDYQKFVVIDGKVFSHILDPRTGYPVRGLTSVTVFAPKAEIADALATSVFVMGVEVGLNRINQLPNVECIVIDILGKIYKSDNIKIDKL